MAASHRFEVSSPSLSKCCGPMDREQLLAHSKHLLEPGYHFSFVAWIDLLPRLHAVVAVFDSDEFASYIGFFPRLLKAQGIFKVHLRVRCTVNQQNRRHDWPGICNRRPLSLPGREVLSLGDTPVISSYGMFAVSHHVTEVRRCVQGDHRVNLRIISFYARTPGKLCPNNFTLCPNNFILCSNPQEEELSARVFAGLA